ncbi:hypothetical protein BDP27DRAFT_1427131 [Rhodocollybia butyracea]|uniref:Uncharacterized protein n=1 Tax=Rhodocollybia butyracea TaxID=206335 RepID=A0A9P5PGY3_9AGAR|nr:hypothetical protein BDP27DRAFT_1427131 [Rhodocollybia butyracea]
MLLPLRNRLSKEALDEYFQCQSDDNEATLEEHARYFKKRKEQELEKKGNGVAKVSPRRTVDKHLNICCRKQEAAAAKESERAADLDEANNAWQWDGEARILRLLDWCPSTGTYTWNGRYEQRVRAGRWITGTLERCNKTGLYIWTGKGPAFLEQQPRPMPLVAEYTLRAS